MENKINEHILRITGTACLPSPLKFGKEYKLEIDGSVINITKKDRQDGSFDFVYTFKQDKGKILLDKEKVPFKDKSSRSQRHRLMWMHIWEKEKRNEEFEDFYDRVMAIENYNLEEIYHQFVKPKIKTYENENVHSV